jgi:hypothetical protein
LGVEGVVGGLRGLGRVEMMGSKSGGKGLKGEDKTLFLN